ncbi:glycosyltransferase [Runella sp.]|uniref:glycosyltransferase n=1 Tax=Runella sp. TaxID=1960881 RepID=UPI003D12499F
MEIFYSTNWLLYPTLNILLGIFALIVLVQLYYILFVFTKLLLQPSSVEKKQWPAVTVVVCAHNELENLRELLPMLQEQDYPDYEVIVVDDRSWDGTEEFAETEAKAWGKVRFLHVRKEYDHVTPKKYAVTTAVRGAKHEVILLTDADCRPTTDQWIRGMAAHLTEEKQIVLGFSPYEKHSGLLNRLIRFETFYVAVQYLSLALAGKPYMAVGRNLMYKKSLFTQNKGFYTHLRITGGDDDLLMNEIATEHNTAVCLDADTFMVSIPKTNWSDWYRQKTRHLSVSKYYKTGNKVRLAILSGTHVLSWLLFLGLLMGCLWNFPTLLAYILIIGVVFGLRFVAQWIVLGLASRKLYNSVDWFAIPWMDMTLFIYYFVMSFVMWYNRRKKVRWK